MENLGLNGIIAVGKGSENPPKLIIMEYNQGVSGDKPILLVGKLSHLIQAAFLSNPVKRWTK